VSFAAAVGNAACILTGRYIGNQRLKDAKTVYYMSLLLILIIESVIVAALLIWKVEIGHLFSIDDEVAIIVSNILPMLSVVLLTDAINGVSSATFYGIGRQKWKLYNSLVEVSKCLPSFRSYRILNSSRYSSS
jgi:MATE family multidrug resistance protein